jgi:hypothetical protein
MSTTAGHPLDALLAEARERLARAERELADAQLQLGTLERARAAVGEVAPAPAA